MESQPLRGYEAQKYIEEGGGRCNETVLGTMSSVNIDNPQDGVTSSKSHVMFKRIHDVYNYDNYPKLWPAFLLTMSE